MTVCNLKHHTIMPKKSTKTKGGGPSAALPGSPQFKVVGRYCYAPVESVARFATRDDAEAELKRWKKDAAAQGQHIIGRVVVVA